VQGPIFEANPSAKGYDFRRTEREGGLRGQPTWEDWVGVVEGRRSVELGSLRKARGKSAGKAG